jgi:hypothetical protein
MMQNTEQNKFQEINPYAQLNDDEDEDGGINGKTHEVGAFKIYQDCPQEMALILSA